MPDEAQAETQNGGQPSETTKETPTKIIPERTAKSEDIILPETESSDTDPKVDDLERRKLSQSLLAEAMDTYTISRIHELLNQDGSRDGSEVETSGRDTIAQNHSLLEPLGKASIDEDEAEPFCTICIPVAILKEDEENIFRTVNLIQAAQKKLGKPVEIVLWMNAKYQNPNDEESTKQESQERYDNLKTRLQGYTEDGLRIQTALQVLQEDQVSMSRLRANYMDAVAMEGIERGYGFEHPILWLDADTTFMAKNTIGDIASAVRNFDALFVHANTQFSADWATGKPLAELDDATKAVAINEIKRRQLARQTGNENTSRWRYNEESGLGVALGTYLKAGGVDTAHHINESASLIHRVSRENNKIYSDNRQQAIKLATEFARDEFIECQKVWYPRMQEAKENSDWPGYEEAHQSLNAAYLKIVDKQPVERSIVPLSLLLSNEKTPPRVIKYIKSARLGISGRRHHTLASIKGASGLEDPDRKGYSEVGLFSDTRTDDMSTSMGAPINQNDMKGLINSGDLRFFFEHNAQNQKNNTANNAGVVEGINRSRGIIDGLIKKYFKT